MITLPLEVFIIICLFAFVGLFAIVHKVNKALDKGGDDRL